jgi:hypothetical protein
MVWNAHDRGLFLFYYIFGAVSLILNGAVLADMWKGGKFATSFTHIIFALHVSIVVEEIVTLPYVFNDIQAICIIAELIHYYCVLLHMVCVACLILTYYSALFEDRYNFRDFLEKYGIYLIYLFPCIILFRLCDSNYENVQYPFCVIHAATFDALYLFTYYLWVWFVLAGSVLFVMFASYHIYRKSDALIAWRFICSVGVYILAALIGWLPTTIIALAFSNPNDDGSTDQRMGSYVPVYASGLIYAFIFFKDRHSIFQFEAYSRNERQATKDEGFNIDGLDLMHMLRSSIGMDENKVRGTMENSQVEFSIQNPIQQSDPSNKKEFIDGNQF